MVQFDAQALNPSRPVLIAGPTASGKSALALHIARTSGGVVVNADAMQVFQGWPILSAQPNAAERALASHALYGHIAHDAAYSVGDWLRDLAPLLAHERAIIVGGTGLYFTALTQGLSPIPKIPPPVRARADQMSLGQMTAGLDPQTLQTLDLANRARVQRAWEVQEATARSLAEWHKIPAKPLLALGDTTPLLLDAPRDWLTPRIEARFDRMLDAGLLAEAEAMLPRWSPDDPSSKTIGAAALIRHLRGEIDLDEVRDAIVIGSRQYAKRQRTWFHSRMGDWTQVRAANL